MENEKKIVIIAGEASGDIHAANLVSAINRLNQEVKFFGLGGDKMEESGVKLFYNLADLAVVGFFEVIKNLKKFRRIFFDLLKKIDEIKPQAVILIDYPGFNLRLAKELKKRKIKVIYYISPQIWAWGGNRIETIKRYIDKMIVILKFEEELYYNSGIDVSFVGHPLLDIVLATQKREEFLKGNNLSDDNSTISLLPGSREKEVQRMLPIMLQSAKIIHDKIPYTQFILIKSYTLDQGLLDKYIKNFDLPIKVIENDTYNCLNVCDFAIVTSGTATLETAIFKKPMVILYKISFLTWLFLRTMIKIPYIGLVNVIANKKIVPEYIQYDCNPKKISTKVIEILTDKEKYSRTKSDLEKTSALLGSPGASNRAAKIVLELL